MSGLILLEKNLGCNIHFGFVGKAWLSWKYAAIGVYGGASYMKLSCGILI